MIIAIPVRDASSNEQLRYALRAWQIALPDAQPVVIGGRPSWYQGNHIPTNQQRGRDSQWRVNFPLALRAIIDSGLVREDEPFIWTADDIFPLSKGAGTLPDPHDLNRWPTWCRQLDLPVYVERWKTKRVTDTYTRMFIDGMQSQLNIIRELGIETHGIHNADIHLPHVLRPDRVRELLEIMARFPDHPAGHFRAIYGALWPGRVSRVVDPKIASPVGKPPATAGWVSTCTSSWNGQTGALLRRMFPHATAYEKRAGER